MAAVEDEVNELLDEDYDEKDEEEEEAAEDAPAEEKDAAQKEEGHTPTGDEVSRVSWPAWSAGRKEKNIGRKTTLSSSPPLFTSLSLSLSLSLADQTLTLLVVVVVVVI